MAKDKNNKLKKLQLKMLRSQQGIWHKKERLMVVFEGFDAAGKGGSIRRVTENLDPRGVRVHPIGPPSAEDQGKHWLYRFWVNVPAKGMIAIFDRSWYGRVLVERVEKLTSKENWTRAYTEINQFEKLMIDDGVTIIKIFLKISKKEQLKRFEERLGNPYKQWKITKDDIRNRKRWDDYDQAVKEMIEKTSPEICPWHLVETDDKDIAREEVLKIITKELKFAEKWMEEKAHEVLVHKKELMKSLKALD
jgi:AMP-polyphosphate phosphotransferase